MSLVFVYFGSKYTLTLIINTCTFFISSHPDLATRDSQEGIIGKVKADCGTKWDRKKLTKSCVHSVPDVKDSK